MQKLTNRLLITPPLKHDESLTGYLVRVADLNNYDGPYWLMSVAGLDKGNGTWRWPSFVFSSSTNLKNLGETLGLSSPQLETLLYPPAEAVGVGAGNYMFYGAPVPQSVIHPQSAKICPMCLKESPHCRRVWDFKLVTCCPTHQCLLVDMCPRCNTKLKWCRRAIISCSCGFDLRRTGLQPINDAAYRLSGIFHRLCGLPAIPQEDVTGESNPLPTIKLENAVAAVLFFSSILLDGSTIGYGMALLSNRDVHNVLVQAASIFEGWPDRFHAFMESYFTESLHQTIRSSRDQRSRFYRHFFLNARLSDTELDFFRSEFGLYMKLRKDKRTARKDKRTAWHGTSDMKYISFAEAKRRLKSDDRVLRRFISQGKFKTIVKEDRRKRLLVEAESVERLKEELNQLIDVNKAAKWLGVPPRVVKSLSYSRCLAPARGPWVDGSYKLLFAQRDVVNLMRDITSRLPKRDPLFVHCPDLRMAVKRFGPSRADLASKIKAILGGDLFPLKQPAKSKRFPLKAESPHLPF